MRRIVVAVVGFVVMLSGLTLAGGSAQAAEAPGVYDISFNRTIYKASGTMTVTWRGVIPDGMTTTGDANCTLSIGGTDVGGPYSCRSGEPFTYDVGTVANTATVTVKVEQIYFDPAITLYGFFITGTKTTTVDGQTPAAGMQVLVTADGANYAPEPMPPGQSYKQLFSVSDNVAVQGYTCAIRRTSPAPVTVVANVPCTTSGGGTFTSPSASGTYAFVVTVTDTAGNTGEGSRTFSVDATAPSVSITAGPANGAASDGHPSWSWTSDDANATYKCWFGAQGATPSPTTCTSPFSAGSVPSGSSQFVLVATDALGNSSTLTRNVAVDANKPTLTLVSPSGGAAITSVPFTISVDASEAVTWVCKRDLGAWTPCGTDGTTHLNDTFTADMSSDGPHKEMIRAVDAVGNLSDPLTVNYAVDVTPLPVMQSGPTEGSTSRSPSWTWTDNLAGNTYECSLVPANTPPVLEPCDSSFTKSAGLTDGEYELVIRSTNPGYGTGATTIDFTLDRTPPAIVVESGPADGATVTSSTATYALSSEAGATFECSWSRAGDPVPAFQACTSPVSVPLDSPGTYLVSLRARDAVGNVSTAVARTVIAPVPTLTVLAPTIAGNPREGYTLTARPGPIDPRVTLAYQWKADGQAIAGATQATMKLGGRQAGRRVTVTVTATYSGVGAVTKTSPPTRLISSPYKRLVVSKTTVKKGTGFAVTATGFTPGQKIKVILNGKTRFTGRADAYGVVNRWVTFKSNTKAGTRSVRVSGYSSKGKRNATIVTWVKYVK